ncbi:MAG: phage holin family protein [Candidatus Pacebacteria bacterium]|nr:phage holin family protein [Candidatus Paceibacterota bacterium]
MIRLILSFVAVLVTANLVGVTYSDWIALLIFTVLLALVNFIVKPILKFFTWPINFLTLGLFHLVLNVLLIMLISYFTPGFVLASFWQAAIFAIVLSLVEWVLFKFDI